MGSQTPTLEQVSLLAGSQITPSTGLEGKSKTPTFPTLEQVENTPRSEYKPGFFGGESMGLNPDDFPFSLAVGSDNVEMRAQEQGVGEQTIYGAGRLLGTTATKFLEGFGYLYGMGEALVSDKSLGEAIDNGWVNFFGKAEEALKQSMPIYHTRKYNEGNILQQMGTYGFYMDDMVDGLAFLASALIGSKGIQLAGKATGAYTGLAKAFSKATKMAKFGKVTDSSMIPLARIIEEMDMITMSAFNSAVEASFEAKDTMDSLIAQGASREEAAKAAAGTFKWNMGILMVPNYITNSMFFGKANPLQGRIKNIMKDGKLIQEVAPLTKAQKAMAFGGGMAESMISESQEENVQLAIQDYFTALANGKESRGEAEGVFSNWVNNFTTDEGIKSMALGALIGMIPGGYHGMKQREADQKNEATLHSFMSATIASTAEDLNKRDIWLKDDKKNVVIDPDTKKPMVDPFKLALVFALEHNTNTNLTGKFAAVSGGNDIMLDRLDEESLASFAIPLLGTKDGLEVFDTQLELWARQKVESATAKGQEIDEKEVQKIKEKYKSKGRLYKTLYDNVEQVFAGLYDFQEYSNPDKNNKKEVVLYNLANQIKDNAIRSQFMASVEQLFWADKVKELQSEIYKLESTPVGQTEVGKAKVEQLNKLVEATQAQVAQSEKTVKSVLKENLWKGIYDKTKKRMIEELEASEKPEETPKTDNKIEDTSHAETVAASTKATQEPITSTPVTETTTPVTTIQTEEEKLAAATIEEEARKARKQAIVEDLNIGTRKELAGQVAGEEEVRAMSQEETLRKYGDYDMAESNLERLFRINTGASKINVYYQDRFGELFIDSETNEVIFKDNENGKEFVIGKTTDESLYNGTVSLYDLGITPINHTVFDMSFDTGEAMITVQGRRYRLPITDPYSAIEEDENGHPVAVTLKDVNGTPLRFTNKTLVEELAYSIALLDEARAVAEKKFLDRLDAEFVVVKDRASEYYVYQNGSGVYEVVKHTVDEKGKSKNIKITSPVLIDRVLTSYFKDLYNIHNEVIQRYLNAGQRLTPAQIEEINKSIQDEIEELARSSRPATEKDAVDKLSSAAVPASKTEENAEASKQDVGEAATQTKRPQSARRAGKAQSDELVSRKNSDEDAIVDEKAEELSKGKKTTKKSTKKTDVDGTEALNEGDFFEKREMTHTNGIAHPATAMAWKAEENDELNKYLSDSKNNLKGHYFVAEIDTEATDPSWTTAERSKEYIAEHIDDEIDEDDENYDSLVDKVAIKLTLYNSKGEKVAVSGMYMHRSDFANEEHMVVTAAQRRLFENGNVEAYNESRRQMVMEERAATRQMRRDVLKSLLDGKEVKFTKLVKGTGAYNRAEGNRNILDIVDSADEGTLVIADNNGILWDGTGTEPILGNASPGNVLWLTHRTANGEPRFVKMNTAKLSEEHARILLKAYIQAANSPGGVNSTFEGDEVTGGLTVKEVIDYLVFEGPKTDQEKAVLYQQHLVAKQLFLRDGILYYGTNKLNLRKKNLSADEITNFVNHITMHKNYNVPTATSNKGVGLGAKLKKSFTIGGIKATAKESYQSFLFKNGMVLTDLIKNPATGTFFHAPSVSYEYKQPKKVETKKAEEAPVKEEKKTTKKKEPVKVATPPVVDSPVWKALKDIDNWEEIPAGIDMFTWLRGAREEKEDGSLGDSYSGEEIHVIGYTAKDASGNTVFKKSPKVDRKDLGKLAEEYDGMVLNEDNIKKLMKAFSTYALHIEIAESPNSEAETFILNDADLNDILDEEAPFTHMAVQDEVGQGNIDEAIKNIRRKLGPEFTLKIEEDLIRLAGTSRVAFATFQRDVITLSKKLAKGSEYEEAFHRVSLLYLSPEQQKAIYKEARTKYNMKDATDRQVNEKLAEEYRLMELHKEKAKTPTTIVGKIKQFFTDLFDFIHTVFTGRLRISNLDIDNLFRVMQKSDGRTGRLWYAKPNPGSYALLKRGDVYTHSVKGRELKYIKDTETLTKAVKHLIHIMVTDSGIIRTKDIASLRFMLPLEKVKASAAMLRKRELEYKSKNDTNRARTAGHLAAIREEIVANYDIFLDLMKSQLEALNIRTILPENPEDAPANEGVEVYAKYEKASFEMNSKDNMGTAIKLVIATLPTSEAKDSSTGFLQLAEYDIMRDTLHDLLGESDTYEDMLTKLESMDGYAFKSLLDKLKKDAEEDEFDTLGTQFYQAMRKPRMNYVTTLATKKGGKVTIEVINSEVNDMGKQQSIVWGQDFLMSPAFTNGLPNKEYINGIIYDYNILFNDLRSAIRKNKNDDTKPYEEYDRVYNGLISIFNKLSIPIDKEVMDIILAKYDKNNKYSAIAKFMIGGKGIDESRIAQVFNGRSGPLASLVTKGKIVDARGKERLIESIFANEKFFTKILAPAYIEVNGGMRMNAILGPDGNPFYLVSERSFLHDLAHQIRLNQQTTDNLRSVPFNAHSFILEQLRNPKARERFNIAIFSNLAMRDSGDRGRGYEDLNPTEDLLVKMGLFEEGHIVFPQMGDRGHLYMITKSNDGVQPIRFNLIYDSASKTFKLPQNILDLFYGYLQDEWAQIQQVKKEIKEALEVEGGEDTLIENYHFKYNSKGERDYTAGNGLKFQHFADFNNVKGLDLSAATLKGKPTLVAKYKNMIGKILNDRMEEAIRDFAAKGVINISEDKDGNIKQVTNKLLDEGELSKKAGELYGGNVEAYIRSKVANFLMNSMMATIESEKMFFGSPAFYKDLDDKIKRYTAVASTGAIPRLSIPASVLPNDRLLHNNDTFNSSVLQTQKFSDDDLIEILKPKFVAIFEERGYKKEAAEKKAEEVLKGYKKVDPTDGQAYISPMMFRAIRIRMGEWSLDNEEAYNLILEDRELTTTEQNKVDDLFMQPLKYGYFGPRMSSGRSTPLYYKMSLATLTPRLVRGTQLETLYEAMTSNTDPIDMVVFDSAVKVGASTKTEYYVRNEKGEVDKSVVNMLGISKMPIVPASFRYLRRQTFTEPHNEMRDVVKTQFRKINLSNIVDGRVYQINGQDIEGSALKELNRVMMDELSNRGAKEFFDELGIDESTLLNLDNDKLFELLRTRARMSGMPDALIDALAEQADGEKFEPDALPDRKWVQSTLLSLLSKKTVDLKLPGTSLIQMANFGLQKANTSKNLRLIDDEGYMEAKVSVEIFRNAIPNYYKLSYKERLDAANQLFTGIGYRVPTQGLVSTVPLKIVGFLPETSTATIVLPESFTMLTGSDFDIDKLYFIRHNYDIVDGEIVKKQYLTDENSTVEQRLKTFSREAIKPFAKNERKALHAALMEKYGKREELRGYINSLRDEFESLSTDEADLLDSSPEFLLSLDKKRLAIKSEKLEAKMEKSLLQAEINRLIEETDTEIELEREKWEDEHRKEFYERSEIKQNTTGAIENRLIDSYFAVQLSGDHIIDNYMPLDTPTGWLKDMSSQISELEGKDRNYPSLYSASFMYQGEVKNKYLWGKKGIGPFARANVHHILGQIAGIYVDGYIGAGNTTAEGNTDLSQMLGKDNESILDWISALITAHVDIAKDAYIFNLNVNAATYSVAELLIRSGVGGQSFWFLAQPILKEYALAVIDSKGKIRSNTANAIKALRGEYMKRLNEAKRKEGIKERVESTAEIFDTDRLKNDIDVEASHDAAYYARQLQILQKFSEINKFGTDLFNAVESTTVDTKRFGNNLVELRRFSMLVNKVLTSGSIKNMDKLFDMTYVGTYYQNSVVLGQKLFKDTTVMASECVTALIDRIMFSMGMQEDTSKDGLRMLNRVSDEIFAGIAGRFIVNQMGVNEQKLESMLYGDASMVHRLVELKKNKKYRGNPLLKLLQPSMSFKDGVPDIIITFTATDTRTKWTKDRIIDGWSELLTSKDDAVKEFAQDLVTYSFFTSGFRKSIHSFFHYIPPMYLKEIGFSQYMKDRRNDFNDITNINVLESVFEDFFQHNFNGQEDDIVPFVPFNTVKYKRSVYSQDGESKHWGEPYPFQVALKLDEDQKGELLLGKNAWDEPIYRPFIKMEVSKGVRLYKYVGYITEGKEMYPVYVISQKKGYVEAGKLVKEHGLKNSVIQFNEKVSLPEDVDLATFAHRGEAIPENIVYDFSTFQPIEPAMMKVETAYDPAEEAAIEASQEEVVVAEENKQVTDIGNQVVEGDIFKLKGIKVIPTNLGGVHGAGLAKSAYDKGWIKKGKGDFSVGISSDLEGVITFPVKKVWRDKTDMKLLNKSLKELESIAKQGIKDNPDTKILLPLVGLGHGEGDVNIIVPMLKKFIGDNPNITLVLPTQSAFSQSKKGTARVDKTMEQMSTIKSLLGITPTEKNIKIEGVSKEAIDKNNEDYTHCK